MNHIRTFLPAALVFLFMGYANANDLTEAAQGLCDTVKSCALEQVAAQSLTADQRERMDLELDNVCASIHGRVGSVPPGHTLYQPAVGCMRSMASLDCRQLSDPAGAATPECEEYDRLAKNAAVVKE